MSGVAKVFGETCDGEIREINETHLAVGLGGLVVRHLD